jgi:hypothetical protein
MVRFKKTVQAVDDLPLEITHRLYRWDAPGKKPFGKKKCSGENLFMCFGCPLCASPAPVGGSIAHAMPLNYLYRNSLSFCVQVIRELSQPGRLSGGAKPLERRVIFLIISHEKGLLPESLMGVETPKPPLVMNAADPKGAPRRL